MAWARRSVEGYGRGDKEASRAYARPGVDSNVKLQAMGRMGECAFCLFIGQSPRVLDWGPLCDAGWDVVHLNRKIDVKTSATSKLIWPVTKNHFLGECRTDIFVAVNGAAWLFQDMPTYTLLGWTGLSRFISEHRVAPPPDHFDPETKYMDVKQLFAMERLLPFGSYCHCGAPGLHVMCDGFVPTGRKLWFCQDHKPDFRALRVEHLKATGQWPNQTSSSR